MTDQELTAWLRDLAEALGKEAFTRAADRIEELVKERDELKEHIDRYSYAELSVEAEARCFAEAKLTKAVEALEVYACGPECVNGKCYDTGGSCGQFAADTLAEIKGESHE